LPVVIQGETGTGKELVARALHELSPRRTRPFIDINCAAIPESLAEGELFGWERGAFTGALQRRVGLLELADGGTLFLDELCSLARPIQAKLLRAVEQRTFRRVGGRELRTARCRLVAAISSPLEQLLQRQVLRSDFLYRIAGIVVRLPPLRARRADVEGLSAWFLRETGNGAGPVRLDSEALALLRDYDWPGNVRELRSVVERLAATSDGGTITAHDVAQALAHTVAYGDDAETLRATLELHGGNATRAAQALGIARSTLYERFKRLGISRSGEAAESVRPDSAECPIGQ
jgi:DNA-binding NtrC family response regulator